MGFLKRLFGGSEADGDVASGPDDGSATPAPAIDEEQARDRELLRDEARRLDDELIQRQLRYADRAWTPPAQGGTRRRRGRRERVTPARSGPPPSDSPREA